MARSSETAEGRGQRVLLELVRGGPTGPLYRLLVGSWRILSRQQLLIQVSLGIEGLSKPMAAFAKVRICCLVRSGTHRRG